MNALFSQLRAFGIIPVVVIDNEDSAEPLAQALIDGGLPCAEITFRTAAAENAIQRIAAKYPSMLVGAGTVLSVDQAKKALDAGAKFIVSPGLNQKVVEFCLHQHVTVIPGVLTPTEVSAAIDLGLEVVKFFPAEASGGVAYLKAISAPFKGIKFIPTGGIDESNLLSYLQLPSVLACGGSWMVKPELIASCRFDEIAQVTARAVRIGQSRAS